LLVSILRYITCEGRYNSTSLYHIRLLEHFIGTQPLNMPYFVWQILIKMYKKDKANPAKAEG